MCNPICLTPSIPLPECDLYTPLVLSSSDRMCRQGPLSHATIRLVLTACMCRQDPPSKDQFGDGKYDVEWTRDLEKYEQWWAQGTQHTQQLARQLEEEGRPKSAARVSHWLCVSCHDTIHEAVGEAKLGVCGQVGV